MLPTYSDRSLHSRMYMKGIRLDSADHMRGLPLWCESVEEVIPARSVEDALVSVRAWRRYSTTGLRASAELLDHRLVCR